MRAFSSSWLVVVVAGLCIVPAGCSSCTGGELPVEADSGRPSDASMDAAPRDGSTDASRDGASDASACDAVETCNGVDDDCDGVVDDEVTSACGTDVGACTTGIAACVDGAPGSCAGAVEPTTELCNGVDDDCNGMTDESCPCSDGEIQSCGSGVGECETGTQTCTAGVWGACLGEVGGSSERCNGLDDNCDGATDEGYVIDADCDGADSDLCSEGRTTCSADGSGTVCGDASGDTLEICNGLDDDCDGTDDNGLTGTLSCGTGVCAATVAACVAGVPQICTPGAGSAETCNSVDDDCNGSVDDGLAPLTCGVGACGATAAACVGGAAGTCTPGAPGVETCNGIDDDCDGALDDGLTPLSCGVGACAATAAACLAGVPGTCTPGVAGVEICNGIDDDCDGMTDEGNPGGGVACGGADVGACIARTTCVGGTLTCRGTFVSPLGTAGGDGSRAMPLASIGAAITNAGILGGGADVCVCDMPTAGSSTFTENVTMVEGSSVLGAYDCNTWGRPGGRVTGIQNVDDDGVSFPAGITSVTALDSMSVDGFDRAGAGTTTAAITVTNSSPTLLNNSVRAGDAATAIALRVVETGLTIAAPVVTGGTYVSVGVASGTAVAVSIEDASPSFSMVAIGGALAGGGSVATTAYGVRCTDCAGTTFSGGNVSTSGATTAGYGFHGTGNVAGLAVTTTTFGGGRTTASGSASFGVQLAGCIGASTWTSTRTDGGGPGSTSGATRTAFASSGAACAPVIDGGTHTGCEAGASCYGVDCDTGSQCVLRNVATVRATSGNADVAVAMRCRAGACARIVGSTLTTGALSRSGPTGIGLELDGASPVVDDNTITGPNGGLIAIAGSRWFGVYLRATNALLTNNLLFDGDHAQSQAVVQYDQTAFGPAAIAPTLHSNTIEYASCATCGDRQGLVVNGSPGALLAPLGVVRNTIIRHVGSGGTTTPVVERNTQSDLQFFENNVLYDTTAAAIYLDEGSVALTLAPAINLLAGSASNQIFDCALTPAWRIPPSAPNGGTGCRNTGTPTSAPDHDFDNDRRPRESAFDIGADEFVP